MCTDPIIFGVFEMAVALLVDLKIRFPHPVDVHKRIDVSDK